MRPKAVMISIRQLRTPIEVHGQSQEIATFAEAPSQWERPSRGGVAEVVNSIRQLRTPNEVHGQTQEIATVADAPSQIRVHEEAQPTRLRLRLRRGKRGDLHKPTPDPEPSAQVRCRRLQRHGMEII